MSTPKLELMFLPNMPIVERKILNCALNTFNGNWW